MRTLVIARPELSESVKAEVVGAIPGLSPALFCPGLQGRGSTLIDRSQYAIPGTINGADWVRRPSGLYMLDYNGTSDYVEFAASAAAPWNLGTSEFTLSLWFYSDAWTGYHILFGIGRDSTVRGLFVGFTVDGLPRFWWSGDGANWNNNADIMGAAVSAVAWHNLMVERVANTIYYYIDNAQTSATASVAAAPSLYFHATNSDLSLGCALSAPSGQASFLNGKMGFQILVPSALTEAQRTAWYSRQKALLRV